ncbi:hypothetical protein JOD55_001616 [Arcanobacterium pluranimalium]|nr:hypothetical protein [Arcanobacterium pluranimalium]
MLMIFLTIGSPRREAFSYVLRLRAEQEIASSISQD